MSDFDGRFIWYELMTSDLPGAEAFYRGVVGWETEDSGLANDRYVLLKVGASPVAGMLAIPEELKAHGRKPSWSGYIGVDDVDAAVARVLRAGGRVHRPGTDIPQVGRFAVVADPQGAAFVLFTPTPTEPPSLPVPGTPGTAGWHELMATEWQGAFDFYASMFGWTKGEAIPMGPMGTYQLFEVGGVACGGMMNKLPEQPTPGWRYYFNVDSVAAAAVRIKELGGTVTNGPHEVPGGSWIIQGLDPQGAAFALSSAGR